MDEGVKVTVVVIVQYQIITLYTSNLNMLYVNSISIKPKKRVHNLDTAREVDDWFCSFIENFSGCRHQMILKSVMWYGSQNVRDYFYIVYGIFEIQGKETNDTNYEKENFYFNVRLRE